MHARLVTSVGSRAAILLAVLACGGHNPPPYDNPPVLKNREEVTEAMRAVGAGLEARVILLVQVDKQGYAQHVRVGETSGNRELDEAALWIGEQMRFEPARAEGEPVAALVKVPITFDVVSYVVRPPKLRNAEEVAGIISRDHADLSGVARFRVRVGPEGWPREIRRRRPSDDEVMPAARSLIDKLKFLPASRGGQRVTQWVNLTLEFAGPLSRVYIDSPET